MDADLQDIKNVATEVRRLESNNFGGASDGLEAADMLNQFKPGLYGSSGNENDEQVKVNDESVADEFFTTGKLPMHHHTSSHHSQEKSSHHSASDDQDSQDEQNDLIRIINEATAENRSLREARLQAATSQMLDLVAEGMDAADAIFDPIAEGESDEMNHEMEQLDPRASSDIGEPIKKSTENNLASEAAREIIGQKITTREHSVSDKAEEDTDIDDDDDGERTPRKWLECFNEFRGEGGAKLKGKLIRRDRAFYQTSNKMNISCTVEEGDFESRCGYWLILLSDWFDTFLKYGTSYIIFILYLIYTVTILVFAGFYYAIAQNCDTSEPMTYSQAFAFSLETATTVGSNTASSKISSTNIKVHKIGYTLPQGNNAMFVSNTRTIAFSPHVN